MSDEMIIAKFAPCYEPELSIAVAACELWIKRAKSSASVGSHIPSSKDIIDAVLKFSD